MHHRPKSRASLAILLTVPLLLLGLYVGMYKWVVVPGGVQSGRKQEYYIVPGIGYSDPVDGVLSFFFMPANWLDRRIRPNVWH